MKRFAACLALAALLAARPATADPAGAVRALYDRFVAAQNARDLDRVRLLLLDSPRFLWVSDGKAIWGRDATLKRMALFQEARLWRVEPALEKATAVEVDTNSAFLHLPLALAYGSESAPERLRFLVDVLAVRTEAGWRIAALFTTTENPG